MTIIRFTVQGECASMKNSREIVMFGERPALKKSDKALAYEKSSLLQIPADAKQMLTVPVRVTLHMHYASERPDLDPALLLDIMAAKYKKFDGKLIPLGNGEYARGESERRLIAKGVYVNDRQVRELHAYHHIDKANPRVEVEIEPLQAQQVALIETEVSEVKQRERKQYANSNR